MIFSAGRPKKIWFSLSFRLIESLFTGRNQCKNLLKIGACGGLFEKTLNIAFIIFYNYYTTIVKCISKSLSAAGAGKFWDISLFCDQMEGWVSVRRRRRKFLMYFIV